MSQNQSYFWQTTRRNVYLRRSAKFHLLMALMTVLTFSTVCLADYEPKFNDNGLTMGIPTEISSFEKELANAEILRANGGNQIPNIDENTKKPEKSQTGFIDAFTASISVILFTELGDKTFFIAAIMAMRHPRLIVFAGAISALALMTVLSVVFGMAATIIPKVYTYYISTALFAIFGLKMIYDGYMMKPTDAQEELEEVQSDLRKREDELMRRAARRKYDDSDAKRKNSNSDKEEGEEADLDSGAGAAQTVLSSADIGPAVKHRQRKLLNNNVSINNNITSSLSNNGCELVNGDRDRDREHVESGGNDVFLDDRDPKMPTFHSSPALAQTLTSSLSLTPSDSNRTNNSDDFNDKINHNHHSGEAQHKRRKNVGNGHSHSNGHGHGNDATAMVHSASAAAVSNANARRASQQAIVIKTNGSIGGVGGGADAGVGTITNGIKNGLSGHSLSSAAGQSNGELKQVGGSNIRLERDVTAALVQDPESGVLRKNTKKSAAYLTTRVLMQAFTMTFLAEWGDRSQLTTIILAASKDAYGVIVGGVLGHSICTGLAVIGGRIVAAKISVRTVTIIGGIVFLGFAVYALIMTPDDI